MVIFCLPIAKYLLKYRKISKVSITITLYGVWRCIADIYFDLPFFDGECGSVFQIFILV